jgi:hypothetical protein
MWNFTCESIKRAVDFRQVLIFSQSLPWCLATAAIIPEQSQGTHCLSLVRALENFTFLLPVLVDLHQ